MRCRGPGDGARISAGNGLLSLRHRPYRDLDMDAVFMLLERNAACLLGPLPHVLKPDIQCVRTHWNRGFMAFQLTRRARIVVLMMPTWPESGFRQGAARLEGRDWPGGRGREFGINGGSSGKDGVNTMGDHRWYSLSYVE